MSSDAGGGVRRPRVGVSARRGGFLLPVLAVGAALVLPACEDTPATPAPAPAPSPAPPPPPPAPQPPDAPANLQLSAAGEGYLEWSWDAVEAADGYEVQFSLDEEFADHDEVIDTGAETVYRREALPPRTGASLRVRSYAGTGDDRLRSDWASPIAATTLAPLPPDCSELVDVGFVGRNMAAGTGTGELTFQALDESGATLDFVGPYTILVPDGGENLDLPGLFPTTGTFVSDLRFVQEEGWFRQTATLEWVADLEIRATAAGCDPVVVSCDSFGCAKPDPGS